MSGITHNFVNPQADGADTTITRPSDWNAAHVIAAGTITEAMQVLADNTTADVAITQHGYAPKAPNDTTKFLRGDATWAVPTASPTWDTIGAAAGSATTANGVNTIVYNTAPTADSKVAWTFCETSAATNGTSSSGVPNQVLLKLSTLAASTQSPLSVFSRGTHVFSVDPTNPQILGNAGSTTNPIYSFSGQVGGGLWSNSLGTRLDFNISASATVASLINTGFVFDPQFQQSNGLLTPAGAVDIYASNKPSLTATRISANTTGSQIFGRKARGTGPSFPSAITTGDVLTSFSGSGYVGGTNKYLEAARIEFDSTGTIGDTTSGIGGILTFSTTLAGTDTAVQEGFRLTGGSIPYITQTPVTFANLPAATNGSVLYCSDCDAPTLIDSTCTSVGAKLGSMAARINGVWKCYT